MIRSVARPPPVVIVEQFSRRENGNQARPWMGPACRFTPGFPSTAGTIQRKTPHGKCPLGVAPRARRLGGSFTPQDRTLRNRARRRGKRIWPRQLAQLTQSKGATAFFAPRLSSRNPTSPISSAPCWSNKAIFGLGNFESTRSSKSPRRTCVELSTPALAENAVAYASSTFPRGKAKGGRWS